MAMILIWQNFLFRMSHQCTFAWVSQLNYFIRYLLARKYSYSILYHVLHRSIGLKQVTKHVLQQSACCWISLNVFWILNFFLLKYLNFIFKAADKEIKNEIFSKRVFEILTQIAIDIPLVKPQILDILTRAEVLMKESIDFELFSDMNKPFHLISKIKDCKIQIVRSSGPCILWNRFFFKCFIVLIFVFFLSNSWSCFRFIAKRPALDIIKVIKMHFCKCN